MTITVTFHIENDRYILSVFTQIPFIIVCHLWRGAALFDAFSHLSRICYGLFTRTCVDAGQVYAGVSCRLPLGIPFPYVSYNLS